MQFSELHKLVKAKKAVEIKKSSSESEISLSAEQNSKSVPKEKVSIDNDPYATALHIINKRQQETTPLVCTTVETNSLELDNKDAIENKGNTDLHEQKTVQLLTDINSSNEDSSHKRPRTEMETSLETNTDKEVKRVMTNDEVNQLRNIALINLSKIINSSLLTLSKYKRISNNNSNNSNNNNGNNFSFVKRKENICANAVMEILSEYISEESWAHKEFASDSKQKLYDLHVNNLSHWMMTDEDKREFELLEYLIKTTHFDSANYQASSTERGKERRKNSHHDNNNNDNNTHNTNQIDELEKLISILWFLVACSWCHDLDPNYDLPERTSSELASSSLSVPVSTNSSIIASGWSYELYLFSVKRFQVSSAMGNLDKARLVAEAHKHWVDAQRSRRSVLEMILYLTYDLQLLRRAESENAAQTQVKTTAAKAVERDVPLQITPTQLRHGLESLFVDELWRSKNFTQARQVYVDLTMGNANWKLGLFSAGEVHMRRSIERVERNRVKSLLNNEKAMILMHSLRQLIHFAERELPQMQRCQDAFYN